jgi:hypothetical protein
VHVVLHAHGFESPVQVNAGKLRMGHPAALQYHLQACTSAVESIRLHFFCLHWENAVDMPQELKVSAELTPPQLMSRFSTFLKCIDSERMQAGTLEIMRPRLEVSFPSGLLRCLDN